MEKILITGSCGFIMGNFIRKAMKEKNYLFCSVDRITKNANTVYANKNHAFHIADITDQHVMDMIFQYEKPDIVIHGAAQMSGEPYSMLHNNVGGTQVIINSCLKNEIKKLIYISDYQVYNEEHDKLDPVSPYVVSKISAEMLVRAASHQGLIYNIARLCHNYGPRQTPDKLIPKVIKSILEEQKISVYGDGSHAREWMHVFDTCAALWTILNDGVNDTIYNISSGQEFSNIEIVQAVCNAMNRGHNLIEHVEDVPGHQQRYSANSNKLKQLGWKPTFKFKEGIKETTEWFELNKYILR
jgi:dTDP-glucose 4,6-dehydratase